MKKNYLLWTTKCKNVKKQFDLDVFGKKLEKGLFFVLLVPGIIFFFSAFIFWGTYEFFPRIILGLSVTSFAIWGIWGKDSKR